MAKRDWITKDFGWKLFSLILAVALWITVRRNIGDTPSPVLPFATVDTITFTNLPVYAVSSSGDVRNAQIAPNAVNVQLSGRPETMAVLEEDKIHAVVNLTGVNTANRLSLPVEVSTPPGTGITVDKIDPPKINVTISPLTE